MIPQGFLLPGDILQKKLYNDSGKNMPTGARIVTNYQGQNVATPLAPSATNISTNIVGTTPFDFFSTPFTLTTSPQTAALITIQNNIYLEQISVNIIQVNPATPSTVYFYVAYGQFSIGSASSYVATQTPINRPFTDPFLPLLQISQSIQLYAYYSGGAGATIVLGAIGFIANQIQAT